MTGHTNYVYVLQLLSESLVASSGFDATIRIWNWNNGALVRTINAHSNVIFYSLNLYNSSVLMSGSCDQKIKFWDISNGFTLIQSLSTNIQITTSLIRDNCKINIFYLIFLNHGHLRTLVAARSISLT